MTSSYLLPMSETPEDILGCLDEKVASPQVSMKVKKLSKLLLPSARSSRKYYRFESHSSPQVWLLPRSVTQFLDLRSRD